MITHALLFDYFFDLVQLLPSFALPLLTTVVYFLLMGWAHPSWRTSRPYVAWSALAYVLVSGILSSMPLFSTVSSSQRWMIRFFRSEFIVSAGATVLRFYDYMMGREGPAVSVLLVLIFLFAAAFKRIETRRWGIWLFLPVIAYVVRWFLYDPIDQMALNLYVFGSFLFLLRDQKKWLGIFLTAAVFVAVNVLAFLWPYEWVNQRVDALVPDVVSLRTEYQRPRLMLYRSAFESDSDLGGPVAHEGTLLFRVEGNVQGGYLRGRTYTDYRGHYWTNDNNLYRAGDFAQGRSEVNYRVVLENLATRTLFLPTKTTSTSLPSGRVYLNADGAAYYKYEDFESELTSYRVTGSFVDEAISEDPSVYLALDEGVTDRTRALAREIAGEAVDPGEVMTRLTAYLRDTYPYTLDAPRVGDRLDFVDTFLFESQRGYCTYYASSLAVMGRTMGVPTRYVEGFLLPGEMTASGYAVTDDRAHAWVEAYLPEKGWTIFEATPAYPLPTFEGRQRGPIEVERSEAMEQRSREDALAGKEDQLAPDLPVADPGESEPTALPWLVITLISILVLLLGIFRRRRIGQATEIYIHWHALESYYGVSPDPELRRLFEKGLYGPSPLPPEEVEHMREAIRGHRRIFIETNGALRGLLNHLRTGVDLIHGTGKAGTTP